MKDPFSEMLKMMHVPVEINSKYWELMEKGQKAMASMAQAQKDMAEFQKVWQELQDLNPINSKSKNDL